MPGGLVIAVHDLRKVYGEFTAVDGVSLDVQPGQIHGFLGPNGAGKTTTIRMIAGLLKPTAGRILVDGHDTAVEPEAAKAALGFIPDRPFIYEKLTAGEFLRFHGGLYGMQDDAIETRVGEMLDLFELGRWRNELVESFSHGMKQRLAVGLRHVEDVGGAEPDDGAFVLVLRLFTTANNGREDRNALLTATNEPAQALPRMKASDERGIWTLGGDQPGIIQTVAMESAHGAKQRGKGFAVAAVDGVGEGVERGDRELREFVGGHDVLLANGLFAVPSQRKEPDSP